MAPRGKERKPTVVVDSDDEDDLPRGPKFEHVQDQYLNQPIEGKQGETRLRTMVAEMGLLRKELANCAEQLRYTAQDVAESSATPDEDDMDDGSVPEDSVSCNRLA